MDQDAQPLAALDGVCRGAEVLCACQPVSFSVTASMVTDSARDSSGCSCGNVESLRRLNYRAEAPVSQSGGRVTFY